MAKERHLNKTPITEAIIDLRISPALGDIALPKLLAIKPELESAYPKCEEFRIFESQTDITDGKPSIRITRDLATEGYIYKTTDERQLTQFRKNGFTFNRLDPYTNWDDVLSEAKRLWKVYMSNVHVERVTRIAVRYINKLELKLPVTDLSEYLVEPPKIPDGIPNTANSYFYKAVVTEPDTEISANIIQLVDKSVDPGKFTLILDNDVYKITNYLADDPEIWEIFSQLRNLKNKIFFATIKEDTARLYE